MFAGDLPFGTSPSFVFSKQASVVTTTSHTAEVSGLKQSVEQTEKELGQVKKQLVNTQGMG